jgi:hypothetical protein
VSLRRGQLLLVAGALALASAFLEGCGTCRGGSPVRVQQPGVGGVIGSSGQGAIYPTGGVGIDLSNVLCTPPDPATLPQPGPGSPPIPEMPPKNAPNAPPAEKLPDGAAPV